MGGGDNGMEGKVGEGVEENSGERRWRRMRRERG